jgi:hypothetical protein
MAASYLGRTYSRGQNLAPGVCLAGRSSAVRNVLTRKQEA